MGFGPFRLIDLCSLCITGILENFYEEDTHRCKKQTLCFCPSLPRNRLILL